ncbi:MAG: branched-chain amino acid aminotransferase [Acidothermus sp.]|nr:branched-chain amino acid aminotransferase [Acidothermus sp.]MCL6538660.1 branched-chain amino acid aminotransferase [Acidothermus sp.]
MTIEFSRELNPHPLPEDQRARLLADPGFGRVFTDHMVTITWTAERGWHDARLRPYQPLVLDPATAVFHYGQAIFEGFKAYAQPDGSIKTFRPEANAARMQKSAERMALPPLPTADFLAACDLLISTDRAWVPRDGEKTLYVRPFMMATEVFLGVRPANHVTFAVIASPAASYFSGGLHPVSIWLSQEYTRAAPGGTGAAKCSGNYAASLIAQRQAAEHGCEQVVFLDAVERRWVEELGGMNIYFVFDDGTLVTPPTSGTILEGVTRDAILTLATEHGHRVDVRPIDIDEWRSGVASGRITEVFACGTAAVVTPIGRLVWDGGQLSIGDGTTGKVAQELRDALLAIQHGHVPDTHGWMHTVC